MKRLTKQILNDDNPRKKDETLNALARALADLHRESSVHAIIAQLEILGEEVGDADNYEEWFSVALLALLNQSNKKYLNFILQRTPQTLRTYTVFYDNAGRRVPKYLSKKKEIRNETSYAQLLLTTALHFGVRSGFDNIRRVKPETPLKTIVRVRQVSRARDGHARAENKPVRVDTPFDFGVDGGRAMHLSELPSKDLINCGHVEVMLPSR